MLHRLLRRAGLVLLGVLCVAAMAASPAAAGTQVVSGDDEHCYSEGSAFCDYTRKLIEYTRGGAPDPSKPILALDCGSVDFITEAYATDPPITQVCPGSAAYDSTVFSTDSFSAIVVGYDEANGGALNARTADFKAFFDQGGGIATFDSGSDQSDYEFLPLAISLLAAEGDPADPYVVTAEGSQALGITSAEMNDDCCHHEVYEDPAADSPLRVGARGDEGNAMLLFARVDRRPPTSASSGCVSETEVGVTVTDENNGSGPAAVRYTIDGGTEQEQPTDANGAARIAVGTGEHTVAFRGVDAAGNVETAANSVTVTCSQPPPPPPSQEPPPPPPAADTTRPELRLAGVRQACVRSAFRVRVTAEDQGGLARVRVLRGARRLASRPFTNTVAASFSVRVPIAGLRKGRSYRVSAIARDSAGNRTRVNRTFRVCAARRAAPARTPRFTG